MTRLNLLFLILLVITACQTNVSVQDEPITLQAASKKASLRAGDSFWENAWTLNPKANPSTWYVMPELNESIKASVSRF